MGPLPTPEDICEYGVSVTQVYPNSATTVFTVLLQSDCAEGLITDGSITGTTITKIGKENSLVLITAIPKKNSIFKGWTTEKWRGVSGYSGTKSDVSINFPINNGTTWYALFDLDCSNKNEVFCFNTDKDKLCSSCEEQKTVYFDNTNNIYDDEGITNNTYWYGNSTLETLITFTKVSTTNRVGWSFSTSSQESSGGGEFKEVFLNGYDPGCSRMLDKKIITLECRPTNLTIPYIVFLYKNGEKFSRFIGTGNSDFVILNLGGNSINPIYKLKYVSDGTEPISFKISTETVFRISTGGIFCNGGSDKHYSTVDTRATTPSLIAPDGFYSQLNNGQYSTYSAIYEVRGGIIVNKTFCGSDILECNSQYTTIGVIDSVSIQGTNYNRIWSSKNLDVNHYRNGDPIPHVTEATEWANLTTGAYCYYNNNTSNGSTYGLLYNWYAVNDSRGLAPTGWKIPTMGDWNEMSYNLNPKLGGKLKETGASHWLTPNLGATNETGFTALPGGFRNVSFKLSGINMGSNVFIDINKTAYFWSSSSTQTITANHVYITHLSDLMTATNWGKASGMSIRLIRN
jgi:uncharacterized protein (TIGR02145 family)